MTRIIGGVAGGRRIAVPPRGTRPTTDRVRESLFNILTARRELSGLAVLDLYAGSGALGLEALSRGAATALFVESDPRSASVIARNIDTLGLAGATLRRGAVAAVLAAGVAAAEVEAVLAALTAHGWVREDAVAVVERAAGGAPLTWPAGWSVWPQRVYGDTRLELAERL
ncbi:16S rRNA (guanine(966)-N(2))-methyltransferase RsmD [Mycobacterium sp. 852002-10029_SCH5224772]|uniref:16S rRNA (guanine(966)-N(2))-methyltransferase RsmD n=1 Tax=Mycobacterium sp. 852002-10029_SCH5224772 TaxID=1834083 RepID=UPI0007FE0BB9|nr:16S rRNA (guanine(966)-N(2))-methyltransferase RsmD [Mycobacterium sp. 852002-10029_SCH5224772]OBE98656.1 16S rRNA (guanine(966)-N(2))-methyltransferase RsmD [Mycobacterium sp. 852002-10029_SCH5224772]